MPPYKKPEGKKYAYKLIKAKYWDNIEKANKTIVFLLSNDENAVISQVSISFNHRSNNIETEDWEYLGIKEIRDAILNENEALTAEKLNRMTKRIHNLGKKEN